MVWPWPCLTTTSCGASWRGNPLQLKMVAATWACHFGILWHWFSVCLFVDVCRLYRLVKCVECVLPVPRRMVKNRKRRTTWAAMSNFESSNVLPTRASFAVHHVMLKFVELAVTTYECSLCSHQGFKKPMWALELLVKVAKLSMPRTLRLVNFGFFGILASNGIDVDPNPMSWMKLKTWHILILKVCLCGWSKEHFVGTKGGENSSGMDANTGWSV